jgi:uncharacterized protein
MRPATVDVSLPVTDPHGSLRFYRDGLELPTPGVDEGILAFELPNLSLFLIELSQYAEYTNRAGVPVPGPAAGACVLSCAIGSKEELDDILVRAQAAGGSVSGPADHDGSYTGYFSDPDGHLWELVFNSHTAAAAA